MKISPYHTAPLDFTYIKPSKSNLELELKVLQHKQNVYNENFKTFNNLRKKALDIKFINKHAKKQIDSFNETIANTFDSLDGNFGDLSNSNIANRYINMFNEFKDTELIGLYKHEKQYRDQLKHIQTLKESKNPAKAGYSPVHEFNYRKRLEEYSNSSIKEASTLQVKGYTPYVDINKLIEEAALKIPESETVKEYVNANTGEKIKTTTKGRDIQAVQNVIGNILSANGEQVKEQAEYAYHNIKNNPEFKSGLLDQYNSRIIQSQIELDKQLDQVNAQINKAPSNELYDLRQQLTNAKAKLKVETGDLSDDRFRSIAASNLKHELKQINSQNYAPQSIKEERSIDPLFKFHKEFGLKMRNYNLSVQRHNLQIEKFEQDKLDTKLDTEQKFKIAQLKSQKKTKKTDKDGNLELTGGQNTKDGTNNFLVQDSKVLEDGFLKATQDLVINRHNFEESNLNIKGTSVEEQLNLERDILVVEGLPALERGIIPDRNTPNRNQAEIQRIDNQLQGQVLTLNTVLDNIIKNNKHYDSDQRLKNNVYINSYKQAVNKLEFLGKNLTRENILTESKKILQDPSNKLHHYKNSLDNKRYINDEYMADFTNSSEEQQRISIRKFLNNPENQLRIFPGKRYNLQAKDAGDNQTIVKNILADNYIGGTLEPASIQNTDLAEYVKLANGLSTITLDRKFFDKKGNEELTFNYVDSKGKIQPQTVTKDSPTIQLFDYSYDPVEAIAKENFKFNPKVIHQEPETKVQYRIKSPTQPGEDYMVNIVGTETIRYFDAARYKGQVSKLKQDIEKMIKVHAKIKPNN